MLIYQNEGFQGEVSLSKDAVMHVKARRLKVGDEVMLCDGKGLVAPAEITAISRHEVICKVGESTQHEKKDDPRLVVGITKLATLEFILQKSVEIGVSEIILLKCEYTPIAFNQALFDKKKERWEKIIISACEQSEQYYKPKLSWMSFADYVKTDQPKCMLHPYSDNTEVAQGSDLMVGPEGGWSEAELQSDIPSVKLNTGILKAETACLAALLRFK